MVKRPMASASSRVRAATVFFQPFVLEPQFFLELMQFEMRFHAGVNLLDLKRLGNIIHRAGLEGPHFGFEIGERAQENHRNIRQIHVRLQSFADFVPVHFGHVHVQQNQVRRMLDRRRHGQSAEGERANLMALLMQHVFQQLQIGRRVVHDHDVTGVHGKAPSNPGCLIEQLCEGIVLVLIDQCLQSLSVPRLRRLAHFSD